MNGNRWQCGEELEVVGRVDQWSLRILRCWNTARTRFSLLKSITPGPPREPRVIMIVMGATTVCFLVKVKEFCERAIHKQKWQSTSLKTRTSGLGPRHRANSATAPLRYAALNPPPAYIPLLAGGPGDLGRREHQGQAENRRTCHFRGFFVSLPFIQA